MSDVATSQSSFGDVVRSLTASGKASNSKNDPHRTRLAAVTTAIVEVAGGGSSDSCSAAQVYAKAVAALEGTIQQDPDDHTCATQAALLELLDATIGHVTPIAIVVATLPASSRVLRALVALTRDVVATAAETPGSEAVRSYGISEGGPNAVLRWTCRVTSKLLRVASECPGVQKVDNAAVTLLLGDTLLALLEDRRPKVRKAAQGALVELLHVNEEGAQRNKYHVAVRKAVSDYCHAALVKARRNDNDDGVHNRSAPDVLHTLSFLESTLPYLDADRLGGDIMKLFADLVNDTQGTSSADYVAVRKVQASTPKVLAIGATLSTINTALRDSGHSLDQLAPRVLASLLQVNPALVFRAGTAEFEAMQRGRTLFGHTLIAACGAVAPNNPDLLCRLLPIAIQHLALLSKPPDDRPDDASCAEAIMVDLMGFLRSHLPNLVSSQPPNLVKCLDDTVKAMIKVLDTLYRPTWSTTLNAFVVLLLGVHSTVAVTGSVRALLDLHNQVPPGSESQRAVLDAFSTLVQGAGIELCWNWIDWEHRTADGTVKPGISSDSVWILSALKTAASVAQPNQLHLSHFQQQVLSLARDCDKLAATSKRDKAFHHTRVVDLWALFPIYCKSPCDVAASLPSLGTTLSRAIADTRYPQLVTIICGGLRNLCESFHWDSMSDEDEVDPDRLAMSQAAVKMLPVLFKLVSEPVPAATASKSQDSMQVDDESAGTAVNASPAIAPEQLQSVVDAISALANVAPTEFVRSLFKKLMHRLVDSMQTDAAGESDRQSALLILAQGLIVSKVLDNSEVLLLYRTLKPLIRNDSHGGRVQKRAYKVLAELCEHYHALFTEMERLKELIVLFSETMLTSQVSARYMRLKCMNILVEGFDGSESEQLAELLRASPELLLCLKDANAKTRDAAYVLIASLASRVGPYPYLKTVAAALAAETPHMRSAAVMAFSRVVFEFAWDDEELQSHLPSLLSTVLALIDEDSREVIKSVVGFVRICVAAIPAQQLEPLAGDIVAGLMKYQRSKGRFRGKIKIILKKLAKTFGYDFVGSFVPTSESKLLSHMKKEEQKQKRKKEATRQQHERPNSSDFDDMLDSDEDDDDDEDGSGDGRTLATGATGFSKLTGRKSEDSVGPSTLRSRASKQQQQSLSTKQNKKAASILIPNERDGEIVDMLGLRMSRQVKFADDHDASDDDDDDDDDDVAMEFDDSGKLVVLEDHPGGGSRQQSRRSVLEGSVSRPAKRRRTGAVGDHDARSAAVTAASAKSSSSARNSRTSKQQSTQKHSQQRSLGSAYKSKRAGGDVKRKNQQLEPYAYVPLDGRSYSKKNRRAAVEQMSSVVGRGGGNKRKHAAR